MFRWSIAYDYIAIEYNWAFVIMFEWSESWWHPLCNIKGGYCALRQGLGNKYKYGVIIVSTVMNKMKRENTCLDKVSLLLSSNVNLITFRCRHNIPVFNSFTFFICAQRNLVCSFIIDSNNEESYPDQRCIERWKRKADMPRQIVMAMTI